MEPLGERIAQYGGWRRELADSVRRYGQWIADSGLSDGALEARVQRILERLASDRISVAFVAEFSRGKSELINAIFFAGHGQRIVPSSAGRTTMCPTELLWDPSRPSSVRLLPIETRLRDLSLAELRAMPSEWREIPVQPSDPDSLRAAFANVQETTRVEPAKAALLGLYDETDPDPLVAPDAQGMVEVPRWRHAIVNFPHPLLELGLVIVDTPGLNAIGAEPELTLNLIPSADAVLFVLAADAGVTRTDIEVWREHVSATHRTGRIVVLNKIDGLWDELKDEVHIQLEIAQQVSAVARTLDLPHERVFPVSAQKALVAKVNRDSSLLQRSRIRDLEYALGRELVPQAREIAREHVRREFDELLAQTDALLGAKRRNVVEQLFELNGLRGKNRDVIDLMAGRIRREREDFDRSLRQLQGLRSVVARHSHSLYSAIGADTLRRHVREAREVMRASAFSTGLRDGMASLLSAARTDFEEAGRLVGEISALMGAMYRTFATQHGLTLGAPVGFSTRRYLAELERIELLMKRQFGALSMVTTEKRVLMRRFFESVAARVREVYEQAGRDLQSWLRAVMAPIESQVREHQAQLKRRLDSVRRVLDANGSLEARIGEIDAERAEVEQRIAISEELARHVRGLLDAGEPVLAETLRI